ncbi:MAG: PE-PPE domain-containing protein, partial [Candidatus Saccharibacteria bacterium]|nr:PE-PPE domain-containing protein [Candidatus Saccharibacteria bacterium]
MSRETTMTLIDVLSSDLSALDDLSVVQQHNTAPIANNENRSQPSMYRLKGNEITEARMVINPLDSPRKEEDTVEQALAYSALALDSVTQQETAPIADEFAGADEDVQIIENDSQIDTPRSGRIRRALGRIASASGSINRTYINGMAKMISAFPGTADKEEIFERDRLVKEKYATNRYDGIFKRGYKALRRNQYSIAAWTPVALLGAIALERFASVGMSIYASHTVHPQTIPFETLPFEHLVQSTDIIVGGHTQGDPISSGYVGMLSQAGLYNPENNNVPIYWSAQMAPISGDSMPMTMSDAEGAQKIVDAVYDAGGAPVRIFSFSQGTEATLRGLNEIAANNGGQVPDNITVILTGTPSGDLGLGKNTAVQAVNPILKIAGLETDQPIPPGAHIIVRTDVADVFGNGGNQSLGKLAEMAVGPGHREVGPGNGVLLYTYDKDGVTYEVWGDPQGINDPLLRYARDQGLYVSPQAEAFMEAALPYTPPGSEKVYTNATAVTQAGA